MNTVIGKKAARIARGFFRKEFFSALGLAFLLANTQSAVAQDYPGKKPIRLIVPFAPGGGTDLVARLFSQRISDALGTPVIVDNRGGAGGSTGIEAVVRAAPDGYTLIFGAASYATNAALYKLPYDPVKDITAVSLACLSGYVVAIHPSVPATNTAELIAYAKKRPGAMNYGSSGVGGLAHLATELFANMADVRITHVPYKGTGPALSDLLGGHIQMVFGSVIATTPHIKNNRLRGVGVTMAKRSSEIPDVQAIAETLPGYEAVLWYGVWGPKNLPASVVARWNKEIDVLTKAPDMKERMLKEGLEPVGGPADKFGKILEADIAKWTKVARQAKLDLQ
jgi:tripartite-type tricarboxylate transporter receptor subunit TctC